MVIPFGLSNFKIKILGNVHEQLPVLAHKGSKKKEELIGYRGVLPNKISNQCYCPIKSKHYQSNLYI
jgi:hypothetical protein